MKSHNKAFKLKQTRAIGWLAENRNETNDKSLVNLLCMYVYFDSIEVKKFYNNIDTIHGKSELQHFMSQVFVY